MFYWFRPPIHLCESADPERALCGARVTGVSPTVRPFPEDADPVEYFEDRNAEVCGNCERVREARRE
ncbi:hypothetical protein [Natronomonas marina]|jgi:hypothetical protein|uniref:hypothetical protein n=1 Tax=Natronomonas marina TaxID=2961939 RepID=UPI0020C9530E|nr:hypothetical protein [Natronomonas marina]